MISPSHVNLMSYNKRENNELLEKVLPLHDIYSLIMKYSKHTDHLGTVHD